MNYISKGLAKALDEKVPFPEILNILDQQIAAVVEALLQAVERTTEEFKAKGFFGEALVIACMHVARQIGSESAYVAHHYMGVSPAVLEKTGFSIRPPGKFDGQLRKVDQEGDPEEPLPNCQAGKV